MSNQSHLGSEKRVYQISPKDLPLSCPMPDMRLWDSHPRIYLPITQTGYITCPYCDTEYHLIDSD